MEQLPADTVLQRKFCKPWLSAISSVHAPLGCAVPRFRHLEYFHDHVRIEEMFFEGALRPVNGKLRPDPERLGLGLTFRREEMKRYLIT
jgi:hypothetical protein